MRYLALATDYDGTLASHGKVEPETVEALERLRATERRLLLVTGRQVEDLSRAFDRLDLFDRVVAENGAIVQDPASGRTRLLARPPPRSFVDALLERGVEPLGVGHVIVATREPLEREVVECIRALGLELHVAFNKGAVMVLPPGVTKASGLHAALQELGVAPSQVVGIGDAENDHAFLAACGLSIAVANALDSVKATADWVTLSRNGRGVAEIAEWLRAEPDEPKPQVHGEPGERRQDEHPHR